MSITFSFAQMDNMIIQWIHFFGNFLIYFWINLCPKAHTHVKRPKNNIDASQLV